MAAVAVGVAAVEGEGEGVAALLRCPVALARTEVLLLTGEAVSLQWQQERQRQLRQGSQTPSPDTEPAGEAVPGTGLPVAGSELGLPPSAREPLGRVGRGAGGGQGRGQGAGRGSGAGGVPVTPTAPTSLELQ